MNKDAVTAKRGFRLNFIIFSLFFEKCILMDAISEKGCRVFHFAFPIQHFHAFKKFEWPFQPLILTLFNCLNELK